MAIKVEQRSGQVIQPVGQPLIFVVSDNSTVSTLFKVKFIAEVFVEVTDPNPFTGTPVATFKTTPNNAGVGIFDFSKVVESYVKADNEAANGSEYKGTTTTDETYHVLQTVDKFSKNNNVLRNFTVRFAIEGAATADDDPTEVDSTAITPMKLFNGYVKHTDQLFRATVGGTSNNIYFDTNPFNVGGSLGSSTTRFLTNAPKTQYAKIEDYGTLSFLRPSNGLGSAKFIYYDSTGSSLGNDTVTNPPAYTSQSDDNLLHLGCFPANLRNWSSTFQTIITNDTLDYYTVQLFDDTTPTAVAFSEIITIYRRCPDLMDYESVRLCWLNQYGVWDYYTFTKKSTRSVSTQGTQYTQLEGTWNENLYRYDSYKGGRKAYRVNSKETITINTDFVNEAESIWFEELINSPEVYVVNGYQTDPANFILNTYIEPARLITSSYIRQTIANDQLMQYTFEIEKSKTLRTQAV